MSGHLHLIVRKEAFRLVKGQDDITKYQFNTGVAEHYFCAKCGVKSFIAFNRDRAFTSESNERFDQSLRSQDPAMGIRDLEELDSLAGGSAMRRKRLYAMPANNLLAVWRKYGVTKNDDS